MTTYSLASGWLVKAESDEIHCRLEAGDSAFWLMDARAEVAAPTRSKHVTSGLGFYLSLGNGKTVTSNDLGVPETWTRPAAGCPGAGLGNHWEPMWEPPGRTTFPARRIGIDERVVIMPTRGLIRTRLNA